MKGFARRNQLIITGLAIMIAVAGYLHFTSENGEELSKAENDNEWVEDAHATLLTDDDDSVETMSETTDKEDDTSTDKKKTKKEKEETSKEDSAENISDKEKTSEENEFADISAEDLGEDEDNTVTVADITDNQVEEENTTADSEQAKETGNSIGEAVLVNNTITGDYFSSAKLSREQARAKNEETLMEIVNSTKMEEIQKQEAVNNLIHLTEISEMETAAETLLGAKGFENAIVTITEDSVDVVVDAQGLTKQQMVQIQDIVKRKTKVSAENIVITPVAVEK